MLMDLVGEIVISEAMVTRNPDLDGLLLENFNKAARQLRKLTSELQDIVMSIRMIPVASTFHKMQRIVRDMNRKLGKDVELKLSGEETEVDKNIIDHLSDPLMHLIRNALDHGIESKEERIHSGKIEKASIYLEAKNAGGDVWISVKDDGKGLNKNKILQKAKDQGLLNKPESDYTEKEIYSFILLPGFSTKDSVSEFSGRGVGMDVVRENIEKVGGTILIDSIPGCGTTISIKIPLTLAIIDGMLIAVGKSRYIIPTTAIRESFRAEAKQIIEDTEGNELIMLRGECYSVIRIHRKFGVNTEVTNLEEGIIVVVEDGSNTVCLFADELVGEQQVVVKPIPAYIRKSKGLAGCTIQGDGSISLILDVNGILEK
jgi:two-component system chemotaxis sensor kinase CheA